MPSADHEDPRVRRELGELRAEGRDAHERIRVGDDHVERLAPRAQQRPMVAAHQIDRELALRARVRSREVAPVALFLVRGDSASVGEAPIGVRDERVLAQDLVHLARGRPEERELCAHRPPDDTRVEERRVQQERVHVVGMRCREGHRDARAGAQAADRGGADAERSDELVREVGVR